MRFKPFIDEQLPKRFDQFITLYFPGPKKPWEYRNDWEFMMAAMSDRINESARESRLRRFEHARKIQDRWLEKVRERALPQFRYLRVIEDRVARRDFMFHILLRGTDWGDGDFNDYWKPLWREMSGGIAFTKEIDERLSGLLRYFVMQKGCVLETSDGRRYGKWAFEDRKPDYR